MPDYANNIFLELPDQIDTSMFDIQEVNRVIAREAIARAPKSHEMVMVPEYTSSGKLTYSYTPAGQRESMELGFNDPLFVALTGFRLGGRKKSSAKDDSSKKASESDPLEQLGLKSGGKKAQKVSRKMVQASKQAQPKQGNPTTSTTAPVKEVIPTSTKMPTWGKVVAGGAGVWFLYNQFGNNGLNYLDTFGTDGEGEIEVASDNATSSSAIITSPEVLAKLQGNSDPISTTSGNQEGTGASNGSSKQKKNPESNSPSKSNYNIRNFFNRYMGLDPLRSIYYKKEVVPQEQNYANNKYAENSTFNAVTMQSSSQDNYDSFWNYLDMFRGDDLNQGLTQGQLDYATSSFSPRHYTFFHGPSIDIASNMKIMQGLVALMNTIPALKDTFTVTSSYRPGAKTKQGNDSWHGKGLAIDIVPKDGDFAKLERNIMQSPQVVQYLLSNGLGIIDEYSENGYQEQVGATGNNMHIGRDKLAVAGLSKLMKQYGYEIT